MVFYVLCCGTMKSVEKMTFKLFTWYKRILLKLVDQISLPEFNVVEIVYYSKQCMRNNWVPVWTHNVKPCLLASIKCVHVVRVSILCEQCEFIIFIFVRTVFVCYVEEYSCIQIHPAYMYWVLFVFNRNSFRVFRTLNDIKVCFA